MNEEKEEKSMSTVDWFADWFADWCFSFHHKKRKRCGICPNPCPSCTCHPNTFEFNIVDGDVGSFQNIYMEATINIPAYGFVTVTTTPTPRNLFGKNGANAQGEQGLGLVRTLDNEIGPGKDVQLDLSDFAQTITGPCSTGAMTPSIQIGSVQTNEGFNIYGSLISDCPSAIVE